MAFFQRLNLTTVLGVLIPIVALGIQINWDVTKSSSGLTLKRLSNSSIVQVNGNPDKPLEIFYEGKKITKLATMSFELSNSGRVPITTKDVVKPITLTFTGDVELIEARIDSESPSDLGSKINFEDSKRNSISIEFPLLNPEDKILLSVLVSGELKKVETTSRVTGVKALKVEDSTEEVKRTNPILVTIIFLIGFFGGVYVVVTGSRAVISMKKWHDSSKLKLAEHPSTETLKKILQEAVNTDVYKARIQTLQGFSSFAESAGELTKDELKSVYQVVDWVRRDMVTEFVGVIACFIATIFVTYMFCSLLRFYLH